ncbi:MAG TPA: TIGR02206 family membrane protein [Bryobacteraceae bacterium]|nr:TIGR02206 family membrane protein [Bryobacteraceae bacterium]
MVASVGVTSSSVTCCARQSSARQHLPEVSRDPKVWSTGSPIAFQSLRREGQNGMSSGFRLFGLAHMTILAAIPGAAATLARLGRGNPRRSRQIAASLGRCLAVNEIIWYTWRFHAEGFRFPEGLPLELCDLTLWLTVAATQTRVPAIFEFAWLAGLGGSLMAVLTPDLWAPLLSYPTIYFFLAHGGIIACLLFLVWSGLARPRPGCVWKTLVLLNAYAALVGAFNLVFHTNYMYLCRKPSTASLLDLFGPWPFYIAAGEVTAWIMFWLLWLPFREQRACVITPGT